MFLICYIIFNKKLSIIKRVRKMEIAVIIQSVVIVALVVMLSVRQRRKIEAPLILLSNSRIDEKALEKSGESIDSFMSKARLAGYFNLGDIDTAVMETNGEISFLPKPMKLPLNPKDFNFAPVREGLCKTIISDGRIIEKNLSASGISEEALLELLEKRGNRAQDILLATVNEAGRVDFFNK